MFYDLEINFRDLGYKFPKRGFSMSRESASYPVAGCGVQRQLRGGSLT